MASWDELRETMRQSYKLQQDEADLVSMVWTYDDGRHQKVILRHYKAFDRSLVEFQSAFARIEDLNPTEALRKNAELPLGTIALQGEVYVVLYNAVLDDLLDVREQCVELRARLCPPVRIEQARVA